jgi:hypothetical protein
MKDRANFPGTFQIREGSFQLKLPWEEVLGDLKALKAVKPRLNGFDPVLWTP